MSGLLHVQIKLMTFSYKAAIMKKRLADIASAGPQKWHCESSASEQLTVTMGMYKKHYLCELIKVLGH